MNADELRELNERVRLRFLARKGRYASYFQPIVKAEPIVETDGVSAVLDDQEGGERADG